MKSQFKMLSRKRCSSIYMYMYDFLVQSPNPINVMLTLKEDTSEEVVLPFLCDFRDFVYLCTISSCKVLTL